MEAAAPFHFLNSGIYVGRARDVRRMLDAITADIAAHHVAFGADPYRFDDQRWFHRFQLGHPDLVHLDTTAQFFHTLHDTNFNDFDIGSRGILMSRISNTAPMAIHGNGNGIDTFHAITKRLAKLGWPTARNNGALTTTSSPIQVRSK